MYAFLYKQWWNTYDLWNIRHSLQKVLHLIDKRIRGLKMVQFIQSFLIWTSLSCVVNWLFHQADEISWGYLLNNIYVFLMTEENWNEKNAIFVSSGPRRLNIALYLFQKEEEQHTMNLSHKDLRQLRIWDRNGKSGNKSYISDPQSLHCFCSVGDAVIVSPGFSRSIPLSELEL